MADIQPEINGGDASNGPGIKRKDAPTNAVSVRS